MQQYIGTKQVYGTPMSLGEYNKLRGWNIPKEEDPNEEGYLVQYLDGGKPNHPNYTGYISWSPKKQFENAYRLTTGMTFSLAIEALKLGKRVARTGWNGKGMWLVLIQQASWHVNPIVNKEMKGFSLDALSWIGMKTADEGFVPWLASQTDVLAEDWAIVEGATSQCSYPQQ